VRTILVFGLPGSGKTTFAAKLKELFGDRAIHFNGDEFRKTYNDWDFSEEGRRRQAERMRNAALNAHAEGKYAILDFICPKAEYRDLIEADYEVYMTIPPVRDYPDTTAMFEQPNRSFVWDIESYEESDRSVLDLYSLIMEENYDYNAPTALMIGRFQPFHAGHKALFLKALEKHGQVCIAVRDMPQDENNPFTSFEVTEKIRKELIGYLGKFEVIILPNIVDVVYGRDVGWTVSKIDLPPEVEAISATEIRKNMKQLNLNFPNDFDGAHQVGGVNDQTPKIYESPDKGKTVYERDFGAAPSTRRVVKTSIQQQWNITYSYEDPIPM
jgi:adenylylsulfate kinase